LIDQVFLDPDRARQEVRDEHFGKTWLVMEDADNSRLLQPHDLAFAHSRGCRHAPRLSGQASLSAKFVETQDRNNSFLPLLGNDGDLHLSCLDAADGERLGFQ
jgi:hypothetical protein